MTDTTPVPPVPSREAVENVATSLNRAFETGRTNLPLQSIVILRDMLGALLAEVERLNGINSRMYDAYNKNVNELEQARATVAEQGAALAAVVAEMDKAIDAQGEGARSTTAASVPIHMVQRWRHALGGFSALASAQSG